MIKKKPRTSWNCHNSQEVQFSQNKLMGAKGKAGKGLRWNLVISCYCLSQQILQHLFFSLLCWTAIALIKSSFLRSKVWHLYNTPKGFLNIIALPFSNNKAISRFSWKFLFSLPLSSSVDHAQTRFLPFRKQAWLICTEICFINLFSAEYTKYLLHTSCILSTSC